MVYKTPPGGGGGGGGVGKPYLARGLKYNVGLKTLLLQGLSEPEFYGDLVYKFRKIIGKNDFPYHFKKNCSL